MASRDEKKNLKGGKRLKLHKAMGFDEAMARALRVPPPPPRAKSPKKSPPK